MTERGVGGALGTPQFIDLPYHPDENGDLVVVEGGRHVPFAIARLFVVRAPQGAVRGQHAHKNCAQFLTCSSGKVEVRCTDGRTTETFVLDAPRRGLLVPPGIWAEQVYLESGSVLTVLCDSPYDAADYLRDYQDFLAYRAERVLVAKPTELR